MPNFRPRGLAARWRRWPALASLALVPVALQAMQGAADAQASPPLSAPSPSLPVLHLASLEWLPYVGAHLPENGLSGEIAAAAARQFSYAVHIDFFPWKRAMEVGREDPGYAGYFPAYYTEERARNCHFSMPMGRSTIGLATLRDTPLHWERVSDLASVRIGVVAGYSNGREFDELVRQGRMRVDPSPGDALNLKKLLAGHVQAAVIDRMVLRYLLATDPDLAPERERIAFDPTPLAELTLHVCFQRTADGERLRDAFDAALKHLDVDKLENAYFLQLETAHAGASH